MPVKTYLSNLFNEVEKVLDGNRMIRMQMVSTLHEKVVENGVLYGELKHAKRIIFGNIENEINDIEESIILYSNQLLNAFLAEYELFLDTIEWNGIMSLLDYSYQLRLVVLKLASHRIKSCCNYAENLVTCKIQEIEKNCLDHIKDFDLGMNENLPEIEPLILVNTSFGISDLIRDIIPSVTISGLSVLGYRILCFGSMKAQSGNSVRIGKLMFLGLAIAGCGILVFKLADMKHVVQRHVSSAIHTFLLQSLFVESNVRKVVQPARRMLQNRIYNLQRDFQKALDDRECLCEVESEMLAKAEKDKEVVDTICKQVEALKSQLDSVD